MKWEKVKIGELFQIKHGWAFKGEYFSNEGELIIVTPGNFYEGGGFRQVGGKEKFYTGDFPQEFLLKKNDVIIAMTEQGPGLLGSPALVPADEKYLHNQRIGLINEIDNTRIDKEFIYRLFYTAIVRNEIFGSATGTKVKHTAPKRIYSIEVEIPPLSTQRRIASILSAYDDLIENNLRRIKLLEEKAFLTYKHIVREEQLEKHILSEFGDIITGKTPSTVIADNFGDDVPFIKTPDMHNQIFVEHTDQMLSELGAKSQEKKILPPLSLCVSCIGTAGVVGITSKPSQTNQQINSIVFYEPENVYFFYALMSQMKEQLDALGSNGSTFTNVNKNKFENMEVYVPNKKVLIEFTQEFEAPFNLILTLQKQNTKLREARDILLPRLMNGEIEV
ncbi:MAG TPA: restriction endonuclease subunit S [Candidatus Kapabacteria bacterium]|nr:restriction endonuclease subunit S [Candidatus Kapabacteria bacterium]